MHLTNYAINMMNEEYVHPDESQILEENDATIRTLQSLWKSLERQGIDVDTIQENMKTTCARTMEVYGPLIE